MKRTRIKSVHYKYILTVATSLHHSLSPAMEFYLLMLTKSIHVPTHFSQIFSYFIAISMTHVRVLHVLHLHGTKNSTLSTFLKTTTIIFTVTSLVKFQHKAATLILCLNWFSSKLPLSFGSARSLNLPLVSNGSALSVTVLLTPPGSFSIGFLPLTISSKRIFLYTSRLSDTLPHMAYSGARYPKLPLTRVVMWLTPSGISFAKPKSATRGSQNLNPEVHCLPLSPYE